MSKTRITQEQVDQIMVNTEFRVRTEFGKCTIVAAKLPNGFIMVESSACVDPDNYKETIGERLCRERIKNRIWELEGYRLQNDMAGNGGM